jgi:hypothetical protein
MPCSPDAFSCSSSFPSCCWPPVASTTPRPARSLPETHSPSFLTDGIDVQLAAAEIVALSGWDTHPDATLPDRLNDLQTKDFGLILDWSREVVCGDIVHYEWLLQVGPGQYDQIKVHRVVKELIPQRPIRTANAIFLQHGDAVGFVKFMYGQAAPSVPDDHAVAVYLAQNDVDVWGIDQNWVLVPEETTDFGFMQDWGMDNQMSNLRIALAIARHSRSYTANSNSKLLLLGYSSGAWLGFSYLNAEAAVPEKHRNVHGFVNADAFLKFGPDNEDGRLLTCDDALYFAGEIANGVHAWWIGFKEIGENALLDPDGDSGFYGLTNRQLALFFGCAGWRGWPLTDYWHYWGGFFDGDPEDPDSLPIDTRFLPAEWAFEFMATAAAWQPSRFLYDYSRIMCDEEDVAWDDNLALIEVPILNLGGAGALAPIADHTLGLLGSTDIQHVIVQLLPDDQRYEDFGHIDIWTATQAAELVWQPLLDWIVSHSGRGDLDDVPNRSLSME